MDKVNTQHPDYERMAPKWKRARDVLAGQDAVHDGKAAYLPRLKDQTTEDYDAYRLRAGFFNASWRTVAGLIGMMFRKPPGVELPAVVEAYAPDIDLAGVHVDTFARKVALELISVGRCAVMVDHPQADFAPANLAEAEAMGLRPMLKLYTTEALINWTYGRVNNRHVLTRAVLAETVLEPDGEFGTSEVQQWRVLDLDEGGEYRQRVFRDAGQGDIGEFVQYGDDVYPAMRGQSLDYIPLYIVGIDGIDATVDEPPLIDLFDLNLSHYRTNADYEHGCHYTGLPTPVVTGYQQDPQRPETLYIGSQTAWVLPDPAAKAFYLEFSGQGLGALKESLDRKEAQMALLGARIIAEDRKTTETATTASIHRAGENGVLASIALAASDTMERALGTFSLWAGAGEEVAYQINRDYNPAMIDAQTLTALIKAVQTGQLSQQSLYSLLQRADVADSEISYEDEQERINAAGLPSPTGGI